LVEEVEAVPIPFGERLKGLVLNWRVWALTAAIAIVIAFVVIMGKAKTASSLGDAVDLFKCCILTWKAVVIVFPAFLAAGAIVTFVPDTAVMRYLGRRTAKWKSYSVASITGVLLSVCSCNVVPIFIGILRRGAGIGPAFVFVYAAPAINLITMIMVLQVIGPYMALIRVIAVPVIAVIVGGLMAFFFRKEDARRQAEAEASPALQSFAGQPEPSAKRAFILVALVLSVLLFGAWDEMGAWVRDNLAASVLPESALSSINWGLAGILLRILGGLLLMGLAVWLSIRWYSREEAVEWARQTGILLKTVLPVFIPAVLVIAVIVNHIPIQWIMPTAANPDAFVFGHPNGNRFPQVLVATIFGSLMYFPLLTEVAFVKGMLKHDLALGPAMAILLTGPGLSLPGLILLQKIVGLKKTFVYFILMVILVALISYAFGVTLGPYQCVCRQAEPTF
jgi:uncharacterized membrane protein YraQ (UPF0718 family)